MIITEVYTINGRSFTKTYSDENRYVIRNGESYSEANDPTELGRTYTEGDVIEDLNPEIEQILNIILGKNN